MAYETKVIIIALSAVIRKSHSLEEVYDELIEMAKAEGIALKPFNKPIENKSKKDKGEK